MNTRGKQSALYDVKSIPSLKILSVRNDDNRDNGNYSLRITGVSKGWWIDECWYIHSQQSGTQSLDTSPLITFFMCLHNNNIAIFLHRVFPQ
jgi:hypothetical protein